MTILTMMMIITVISADHRIVRVKERMIATSVASRAGGILRKRPPKILPDLARSCQISPEPLLLNSCGPKVRTLCSKWQPEGPPLENLRCFGHQGASNPALGLSAAQEFTVFWQQGGLKSSPGAVRRSRIYGVLATRGSQIQPWGCPPLENLRCFGLLGVSNPTLGRVKSSSGGSNPAEGPQIQPWGSNPTLED